MPGKEQFMTELKMKEMQLINWFGCPNLIYTRERIHLVAMLTTDEEMKNMQALDTNKPSHNPEDPANETRLLGLKIHD